MKLSHISKHAIERISQRTGVSSFDIAKIIDTKQYVQLEGKPGQTKEYLLFYDKHSDDHFVIFRDGIDGTVVTVMLWDHYENNVRALTDFQKNQARKIANTTQYRESQRPSRIIIVAGYIGENGSLKIKTLEKISMCAFCDDVESFINSHMDLFELRLMAKNNQIAFDSIEWFSIRFGENGRRVCLEKERFNYL